MLLEYETIKMCVPEAFSSLLNFHDCLTINNII